MDGWMGMQQLVLLLLTKNVFVCGNKVVATLCLIIWTACCSGVVICGLFDNNNNNNQRGIFFHSLIWQPILNCHAHHIYAHACTHMCLPRTLLPADVNFP